MMAIRQCDDWMAAKFDTYLAEYQHGLCFSGVAWCELSRPAEELSQ
jgi:hypothetical protein